MSNDNDNVTFSGWVRVNHTSEHRYRCYAVARASGVVEFHTSLSNFARNMSPSVVAEVKSFRTEILMARDPNFVIRFQNSHCDTRLRSEPSDAVQSWIKALRTSSSSKSRLAEDAHKELETANSLETRLILLHEKKLLKLFHDTQERMRSAALNSTIQFDKNAFFLLARAANEGVVESNHLQYVTRTDAIAAYVSLAVDVLKDPSLAKRVPSPIPPLVPEPVARSELELRCTRPRTVSHWAFWPVLPLYGHGVTYGNVSICIDAASLDPRFIWTSFVCVDRARAESLLVPYERSGNERTRRFWHALKWGVSVTIPLRAPRTLSRIVLAFVAQDPEDKKGQHTQILYQNVDLDVLESIKSKRWGGTFLPGTQWCTAETKVKIDTMRCVETYFDSMQQKLFDFTNNAARKKKKGNFLFNAVGGITNMGVGVMGQGISLVGSSVGTTVGLLGSTVNAVSDLGGKIPILGKGVQFLGHTVGDGVNFVGDGIGTGINVVSSGLTETPNMIGQGLKGVQKGVEGLVTKKENSGRRLFKEDRVKTNIQLNVIMTSHLVAERLCCLAYPSFSMTNSLRRDRGGDTKPKSEIEIDAEAVSKLEHALGVLGTAVKYSPMSLVSLFTSAVANFKWLSSAVTVVFIASGVYLYPYMGKAMLIGILGSITTCMFFLTLVLLLANRLFRKKGNKSPSEITETSLKISKTLFHNQTKKIREGAGSDAVKFAVNLFLPILRLRLRRIASWCALASILLLSSAYAMSVYGINSYWGWLADSTLFMVGLGLIFRHIAPVRALTEWIQRVMVSSGV